MSRRRIAARSDGSSSGRLHRRLVGRPSSFEELQLDAERPQAHWWYRRW